jgi:hypothetical protein
VTLSIVPRPTASGASFTANYAVMTRSLMSSCDIATGLTKNIPA